MKTARYAATAVVFVVASMGRAGADPASSSSSAITGSGGGAATQVPAVTAKTDVSQSMVLPDADLNPEIQTHAPVSDINAIVNATAENTLTNQGDVPAARSSFHPRNQSETEASLQNRSAEEKDNDWLVRGYEEQLQSRVGKDSVDQSTNLYYQIATDKDLAKLAGIATIDLPVSDNTAKPHTLASDANNETTGSDKVPSQGSESGKPGMSNSTVFKSLINPIVPVFGSAQGNPSTSLYYDATRTVSPAAPAADVDSTVKNSGATIPPDIDMPGLVAAKNDPLASSFTADVMADISQPEPLPQDSSTLNFRPNLPPDTATGMLQKKYDSVLNVPSSFKIVDPPQLLNPVIYKLPANSEPIIKAPQPNPVRRPIADPLDIPYR